VHIAHPRHVHTDKVFLFFRVVAKNKTSDPYHVFKGTPVLTTRWAPPPVKGPPPPPLFRTSDDELLWPPLARNAELPPREKWIYYQRPIN